MNFNKTVHLLPYLLPTLSFNVPFQTINSHHHYRYLPIITTTRVQIIVKHSPLKWFHRTVGDKKTPNRTHHTTKKRDLPISSILHFCPRMSFHRTSGHVTKLLMQNSRNAAHSSRFRGHRSAAAAAASARALALSAHGRACRCACSGTTTRGARVGFGNEHRNCYQSNQTDCGTYQTQRCLFFCAADYAHMHQEWEKGEWER